MKNQNLLLVSMIFGTLSALIGWSNNLNAQTISGGGYHSLAICSGNIPRAWGYNGEGQLGNSTFIQSNVPDSISFLTDISSVAAGERHSLSLKDDGTVWAWGKNNVGQLGNGNTINSNICVQVSALTGTTTAIASGWNHSFAIKNDSTLWGWGYNNNGQLGNGITANSSVPVQVSTLTGLTNVIAVAGGEWYSLALKDDGTVWAWGGNNAGQLGNGTFTNSNVPLQISSLNGIIAISAGAYHALALKDDSTVWAWGYNGEGQLGNGNNTLSNVPVQVSSISGISGIIAIAGGERHSVALKNDGTVWTWGKNDVGQLGNGNYTYSNIPVQANTTTGLTGITAIAAGWNHTLALKSDATVRAWGYNNTGQLGNGTITSSNLPLPITTLCPISASIKEITASISISAYPNPNNGVFNLQVDAPLNSQIKSVEIFNMLGEKVYEKKILSTQQEIAIDISAQSRGIYLIKIYAEDFKGAQKLIITK